MKKKRTLWLVLYPNGEVASGSHSLYSADIAIANAMQHWLRDDWFKGIEWGGIYGGGALYAIWPALKKNGWKLVEIDLDEILEPPQQ